MCFFDFFFGMNFSSSSSSSCELMVDCSPWCVAIMLVVFDESQGQIIKAIYPSNNVRYSFLLLFLFFSSFLSFFLSFSQLNSQMLNDIKMLSMPDCLPAGSNHQLQYLIRIRNKSTNENNDCLNCFVLFSQSRDSSYKRGFSQRSLVLICKHTFSTLANSILYQLGNVLDNLYKSSTSSSSSISPSQSSSLSHSSSSTDSNFNNIVSAIEVAYQHFLGWPRPKAGEKLLLPFYGEIVIFNVPPLMTYVDSGIDPPIGNITNELIEKNHVHTGLGRGVGLFSDEDLVGLLKTFGLLSHIWILWELVVTGKDILVWAPSPDICSRIVSALVSLAAPLSYGGDFRPYINPYDNDVGLISSVSQMKYEIKIKNKDNPTSNSSINTNNVQTDPSASSIFDFNISTSENLSPESPSPRGTNLVSNGTRIGTLDIPTHERIFTDFHDMSICYSTSTQETTPTTSATTTTTFSAAIDSYGPATPIIRAISRNNTIPNQNQGSCLGNCANPSTNSRLTSLIVGITNPFLLKTFSHFDVAIFLPMCSLSPIKFNSGTNLGSPSHIDTITRAAVDGNVSPHSAARSRKKSLYSSRSSTNENKSNSSYESSSSAPSSPFSSRVTNVEFPCSINRVNMNASLEDNHERWMQSGGAGTSGHGKGTSLLTLREQVSVKQDSRIVQLLSSSSIADDVSKEKLFSTLTSFDEEFDSSQETERDSIIRNMLIREHFRQLTHSLMKPFESHFQPKSFSVPESVTSTSSSILLSLPIISSTSSFPSLPSLSFSSSLSSSSTTTTTTSSSRTTKSITSTSTTAMTLSSSAMTSNTTKTTTTLMSNSPGRHLPLANGGWEIFDPTSNLAKPLPPNGINSAISPTRRIGASFLWLYRNPLELLGNESLDTLVQNYRKNSAKLIPNCFIPSKTQTLFVLFGESDTFQNFYLWRRKHLSVQLMMEMALACSMLTGDELIEQFAIEKGSDVVTEKQVRELAVRISLYIRTLNNIQTESTSTLQELIERMNEHLNVISNLCDSMSK